MIAIGDHIKRELRAQGKSVVWFARELSCNRSNVYKIFNNTSISTHELLRISRILGVDFFAIYSNELREGDNETVPK